MPVKFELHDHEVGSILENNIVKEGQSKKRKPTFTRKQDHIDNYRAQGRVPIGENKSEADKEYFEKSKKLKKYKEVSRKYYRDDPTVSDEQGIEAAEGKLKLEQDKDYNVKFRRFDRPHHDWEKENFEDFTMDKGKMPGAGGSSSNYNYMDKGKVEEMPYDDEKKYHEENKMFRNEKQPRPITYESVKNEETGEDEYVERDLYEKNREREDFEKNPYKSGQLVDHHVSMRKKRELIHGSKEEGDASLFKDYDDKYDKDDRDRRLKDFHGFTDDDLFQIKSHEFKKFDDEYDKDVRDLHLKDAGFTDDEIKSHDKFKTDRTKIFENDEKKYVKKDSDGKAYIAHKGREDSETTKGGYYKYNGEKKREGRFFTSDVKHGEGEESATNGTEQVNQTGQFKNDRFSEGERNFNGRGKSNKSIGKFDENGNLKEGSHTIIDGKKDSEQTFTGRFDRNGNPTGNGTLTTKTTTRSDDSTRTKITQSNVNAEEDKESNAETDLIHNAEKKNPNGLEKDAEIPNSIKNGKKNSHNLEKGVGSLKHTRNNESEYRETKDKRGKVIYRHFHKTTTQDGSTKEMTEIPEETHENGRMKKGTREVDTEKGGNPKKTVLEGNFDENGNFTNGTVKHKDENGNVISKPMSFSQFEQEQGTLSLPTTSGERTMSEMENNLSNAEKIGSDISSESKEAEKIGSNISSDSTKLEEAGNLLGDL